MYQSGRAGDEAKKRKSRAKSGRVGIYEILSSSTHGYTIGAKLMVFFIPAAQEKSFLEL